MFRNMIRTKAQRNEDFEKFQKRMFPFGEQQRQLTQNMVEKIVQKSSHEPLAFYYYLTAADHFETERETQEFLETLHQLKKMKPLLNKQTMAELLALMELSLVMNSLDDFPNESTLLNHATTYFHIIEKE